jgi:hypothetical protein
MDMLTARSVFLTTANLQVVDLIGKIICFLFWHFIETRMKSGVFCQLERLSTKLSTRFVDS